MNTQRLVDSLVPMIREQSDPLNKAQCLIEFATKVSQAVLRAAKIPQDSAHWDFCHMARSFPLFGQHEPFPSDLIYRHDLTLHKMSTALDDLDWPDSEHQFLFCEERVVEWDSRKSGIRRVMTYEEAARFVIFWLAEKILQIIRKNEWDRVRTMPNIFDRLSKFWD